MEVDGDDDNLDATDSKKPKRPVTTLGFLRMASVKNYSGRESSYLQSRHLDTWRITWCIPGSCYCCDRGERLYDTRELPCERGIVTCVLMAIYIRVLCCVQSSVTCRKGREGGREGTVHLEFKLFPESVTGARLKLGYIPLGVLQRLGGVSLCLSGNAPNSLLLPLFCFMKS